MSEFTATIVAPDYPPQVKHQVIFETFDKLQSGERLLLLNDHDPRPLRYQFEAERPNQFTWEYLEEGPDQWQVVIGKL